MRVFATTSYQRLTIYNSEAPQKTVTFFKTILQQSFCDINPSSQKMTQESFLFGNGSKIRPGKRVFIFSGIKKKVLVKVYT